MKYHLLDLSTPWSPDTAFNQPQVKTVVLVMLLHINNPLTPSKTVPAALRAMGTQTPDLILRTYSLTKVSNFLASLHHTGRRRVVLDHTLNTLQHVFTRKSHNVLSKFTILCWAMFTAIQGHMQTVGCRLDTLLKTLLAQVPYRGNLSPR